MRQFFFGVDCCCRGGEPRYSARLDWQLPPTDTAANTLTVARIEERDETFQRQSASGWRCRRDRQGELVRIGIQKHTAGQRRATFPEMSQTAALALRRWLRGGIPRTLPRKVEVVAGHHHRIW